MRNPLLTALYMVCALIFFSQVVVQYSRETSIALNLLMFVVFMTVTVIEYRNGRYDRKPPPPTGPQLG